MTVRDAVETLLSFSKFAADHDKGHALVDFSGHPAGQLSGDIPYSNTCFEDSQGFCRNCAKRSEFQLIVKTVPASQEFGEVIGI
nr:hypothetical protein BaRGS_023508 [Batillaria attramentaria]